MFKKILLGFILLCLGVPLAAVSAQKCVNFGDFSKMFYEVSSTYSDWKLFEADSDSVVEIRGIGVCAMNVGAIGDVADSLEYDYVLTPDDIGTYRPDTILALNDNSYCWCRMLSPALSKWVSAGRFGDAEECLYSCPEECAAMPILNTEFRAAMLGSLGG